MFITKQTILMLAATAELDYRTVHRVVLEGGKPRSATTRKALAAALVAYKLKPIADTLTKEGRIPLTFINAWQTKHAPKEAR